MSNNNSTFKQFIIQWGMPALMGVVGAYLTIITQIENQNNKLEMINSEIKLLQLRQDKSEKQIINIDEKFNKIMDSQNEIKIILSGKADKKYIE